MTTFYYENRPQLGARRESPAQATILDWNAGREGRARTTSRSQIAASRSNPKLPAAAVGIFWNLGFGAWSLELSLEFSASAANLNALSRSRRSARRR